jgi:hypothetical protein
VLDGTPRVGEKTPSSGRIRSIVVGMLAEGGFFAAGEPAGSVVESARGP